MKRKLTFALVTAFSLCMFVLPLSVFAASVPSHTANSHRGVQSAQPLVTSACLTYHDAVDCDGTNPNDTGCSANSFTPETTPIMDDSSHVIGYVLLRASGPCETNWAKVISTIGNVNIYTVIYTQDDRSIHATDYGVSSAYSPQLWTNTIRAFAQGCINGFCNSTPLY